MGHKRCCTYHCLSWTDSIKPESAIFISLFLFGWSRGIYFHQNFHNHRLLFKIQFHLISFGSHAPLVMECNLCHIEDSLITTVWTHLWFQNQKSTMTLFKSWILLKPVPATFAISLGGSFLYFSFSANMILSLELKNLHCVSIGNIPFNAEFFQ